MSQHFHFTRRESGRPFAVASYPMAGGSEHGGHGAAVQASGLDIVPQARGG